MGKSSDKLLKLAIFDGIKDGIMKFCASDDGRAAPDFFNSSHVLSSLLMEPLDSRQQDTQTDGKLRRHFVYRYRVSKKKTFQPFGLYDN